MNLKRTNDKCDYFFFPFFFPEQPTNLVAALLVPSSHSSKNHRGLGKKKASRADFEQLFACLLTSERSLQPNITSSKDWGGTAS